MDTSMRRKQISLDSLVASQSFGNSGFAWLGCRVLYSRCESDGKVHPVNLDLASSPSLRRSNSCSGQWQHPTGIPPTPLHQWVGDFSSGKVSQGHFQFQPCGKLRRCFGWISPDAFPRKNPELIHCLKPVWWLLRRGRKMHHYFRAPITSPTTFWEGDA